MRRAAAIAAVVLAGCGGSARNECDGLACGPCAPPLELRVTLASGAQPEGVVIEGADARCGEATVGTVVCAVDALALGAHEITVRADGVEPRVLSVTLERDAGGCCSCGYQPIAREVVLGAVAPDAGR